MDGEVTRHLRNGERILWQVRESLRLRALWYIRQRRKLMWMTPVALAMSALVGLRPLKAIDQWIATGSLPMDILGLLSALISVAALGKAGLFIWAFFKLGAEARSNTGPAKSYVATNHRLLVMGSDGLLIDEIGRNEVASITRGSAAQLDFLLINRRNGKPPDDSILLNNLDDPQSAKAALESIFPETRP